MNKKLVSTIILALYLISMLSMAFRIPKAKADVTVQVIGGNPPWTNWTHYHNYTEIVNTLLYLNSSFPNIVDLFSIGESWENRTIYCVRMTNETNTDPKPKLFFVGYHHAREPISAELPLYFAVTAATAYGFNESVTRMLNYCEIYIVVALNVDGFEAFKRNEWQRKSSFPFDEDHDGSFDEDPPDDENGNGYIEGLWQIQGGDWTFIGWEGVDDDLDGLFNEDWIGGVDLNRNYGYQWNATCDSGSDDPSTEDFRGLGAFSEPETKALRDLCLQNDFRYAVSFHSGAENILYPWGYTNEMSPDDQLFREIAGDLSNLVGAPNEQSGAWYTTSGVWDDWMYGNRSARAFTCEIYGNDSAWQYEPGPTLDTYWERGITQAFNPDPENIEPVIQRWLPVFTYMAERAIAEAYDVAVTHLSVERTTVESGSSLKINATAANQGSYEETFNVTLEANSTIIQTETATLANQSETTLTFTWNTTGFAYGNYMISAHAFPVEGEADTADNTLSDGTVYVGIPGDTNADGTIDVYDLIIVASAYGSIPSNPNWNPNADINGDATVDIYDLILVASHYGETFP